MSQPLYKEKAIFLRIEKRSWEIEGKSGIAYTAFVLMNGQIFRMKADVSQFDTFQDLVQKEGDVVFTFESKQEKPVFVFKDFS